MTLDEGYAEYLEVNQDAGFYRPEQLSPTSRALFLNHDLIHVIFGLDTHMEHELLADACTYFGVDISLFDYYRTFKSVPEVGGIFSRIRDFVSGFYTALVIAPKAFLTFRACRRMSKKWPWRDHSQYRSRSLREIRIEFGIYLVQ